MLRETPLLRREGQRLRKSLLAPEVLRKEHEVIAQQDTPVP
jgi:hypothetical protein